MFVLILLIFKLNNNYICSNRHMYNKLVVKKGKIIFYKTLNIFIGLLGSSASLKEVKQFPIKFYRF